MVKIVLCIEIATEVLLNSLASGLVIFGAVFLYCILAFFRLTERLEAQPFNCFSLHFWMLHLEAART